LGWAKHETGIGADIVAVQDAIRKRTIILEVAITLFFD